MNSQNIQSPHLRIRIFVDFWNFTLSVRGENRAFRTNWLKLGPLLVQEAGKLINHGATTSFEAMHVYGSYDPSKPDDAKFRHWFTTALDKMPGVHTVLLERQRKRGYPKCPHCQAEAKACDNCNGDMRGTEEKGVDTRIATDMISLAWADGYDAAVLMSADRDFVPVAEFLQTRNIKVIHGAFPPKGSNLSQKCWGNINVAQLMPNFERR